MAASGTTLHQRAGRMDDVFLVYRPGASGGTGSTMAGAAVAGHPYPLPSTPPSSSPRRRCGDLDGNVEGERVWMSCDCGAGIAHQLEPTEPDQ